MFVIPKKGLKILRPDTNTVLLEDGEFVPKTSFWLRRIKAGDVSLKVEEEKKPEPVKKYKNKVSELKTEGE